MKYFTAPRASELERMTTEEIRRDFLISGLFQPGRIELAYTDLDRMAAGGIMPADELRLPQYPELASSYFTERRELGVINLGDAGEVSVGETTYRLDPLDCLYVGIGEPEIAFRNVAGGQAVFYLLSAPAHRKCPTQKAARKEAAVHELGCPENANQRRLVRYIHEGGIQSCQLVMGYTEMRPGGVWNTWPPHTHLRRSEIYLYFGLGTETVFHFLGEPTASRHVVVRDREAVLSPPWSIHTGAGTGSYSFVWGMAGENRTFSDMDPVDRGRFA